MNGICIVYVWCMYGICMVSVWNLLSLLYHYLSHFPCLTPDSAPDWCLINYGAMVCIECSGIHRSLGTHVSKVRSALLDKWEPELLAVMSALGNEAVNEILGNGHVEKRSSAMTSSSFTSSSSSSPTVGSMGSGRYDNPFDNPFESGSSGNVGGGIGGGSSAYLPDELLLNPFDDGSTTTTSTSTTSTSVAAPAVPMRPPRTPFDSESDDVAPAPPPRPPRPGTVRAKAPVAVEEVVEPGKMTRPLYDSPRCV